MHTPGLYSGASALEDTHEPVKFIELKSFLSCIGVNTPSLRAQNSTLYRPDSAQLAQAQVILLIRGLLREIESEK